MKKVEESYYVEFKEIRERIASEEAAERAAAILQAEERVTSAKESLRLAKEKLVENDLLSVKLKKVSVVTTLLEYFHDKRADSIKEAVNLYYEEEHRKRLEEYTQEVVRVAKDADSKADDARKLAGYAYNRANEAYDRADEAYDHADEAYDRVDDAHDRADSAYSHADEAYERADEAYSRADEAYY